MKSLVIVESPTKAKTLTKYLGANYAVKASMGHVRDLPANKLSVDVENNFEPTYEITEKAQKNIKDLIKEAKDADTIYLATDPDREGEAIAWHLKYILETGGSASKSKKNKFNFKRAVFHEITKNAVEEAFKHTTDLNVNLVDAQQGRRVLDRLVGYKLSPLLWKKVRYGLSAGRVQSVAVRLVVERERERTAFKPEEYWTIDAIFDNSKKQSFKASLAQHNNKKISIKSKTECDKVLETLNKDSYTITDLKIGERKRNPYPPFKTSTMQQSASNLFGYSAKQTMSAAQKLFEKGYITYHRTDSFTLSNDFINNARSYVSDRLGAQFISEEVNIYRNKSKNAQEAHEAIRPTDLNLLPNSSKLSKLGDYEKNVYKMIFLRSLECQMKPAVYDTVSVDVTSSSNYILKASGSKLKFAGWLEAGKLVGFDKREDDESVENFDAVVEIGDKVFLQSIQSDQHFTQPPARYSDATLIKALEELEIGRPSTYAPTISTIISRGYVRKEAKYFVPEDVSYVVTDLLVEHFPDVVDYQFTAEIENELDKIAEGEINWKDVISNFYTPFEKNLKVKEDALKKADFTKLGESDEKCPECGKTLFIKLGKYGKFLSCSGFPDCKYAKPINDNPELPQEDFGKCDVCGEGDLILKQGRFGKFLACNNYPKCKNTKPYLEKIGVKCPKCQEGDVIVKKAKRRIFYGCSRYPDCDFASWKIPVAGEPYVEKAEKQKKVKSEVKKPAKAVKSVKAQKVKLPKKSSTKVKKVKITPESIETIT
jgi:DNA topoisomerase-1